MTHSEQIEKLADGLAKAQGKIQNAVKAAENPGFKRGNKAATYADLASVWDACREHLSAHGIAVIQAPTAEGQKVTVETLLAHSSGQWIRDSLSTTAAAGTPQAIGSAITYLRRYSLAAMVGVAPADDDGEAAEGRQTNAGRPEPTHVAEPHPPSKPEPAPAKSEAATKAPPSHVVKLWTRLLEKNGEKGKAKAPKTHAQFEEAAKIVFAENPKPSSEWTPEDTDQVAAFLFPPPPAADPADVPFAPFPNV